MPEARSIGRNVLAEQVKDRLLQDILAGVYPPNSRIVETRVARDLGTSQAPVREALRGLEALGVAVRSLVAHSGDAADFSEMVILALRWTDEQRAVAEVLFKELRPGEWHVALLTITPADVRRRASSRGAKPRAPRRG